MVHATMTKQPYPNFTQQKGKRKVLVVEAAKSFCNTH